MTHPLELLAVGWPQALSREQVAVYAEMLADVPAGELEAALRRLLTTADFRPSVAEIRRSVVLARADVPTDEEAAAQAALLDSWAASAAVPWGAQAEPPPRPVVHPLVASAWSVAGPGSYPAVFARAYRDARSSWAEQTASRPLSEGPALEGVQRGLGA